MKFSRTISILLGPLIGILLAFAVWHYITPTPYSSSPIEIQVSVASVIGSRQDFLGSQNSKYTLVEFADYQCPPCIIINENIPQVLDQYKGKVRFLFRNFPLYQIHPYARAAAEAAKSARMQGKFWPMHDALFHNKGHLKKNEIEQLFHQQGIASPRFQRNEEAAQKAVEEDLQAGKALGVHGTPTFILCAVQWTGNSLDEPGSTQTVCRCFLNLFAYGAVYAKI